MDKLKALKAQPWVAHLLRSNTRFGNRLGNQFAAAVTYFSVLALVPIIMFAFASLGMVVTTLRPEMMDGVVAWFQQQLGSAGADEKIEGLVADYLRNWRGVGIVGLLSLFYAGSGWMGNLRNAVNAQWRPEFEHKEDTHNIVVTTLINMGLLLVMLLGVMLTFGASFAGTSFNEALATTLGMDTWAGGRMLLRVLAFLLTVLCAWLLFVMLFLLLPDDHQPRRETIIGALIAAVLLALLQVVSGMLIGAFSKNKAAALFGPVIVMMLVMNLFARIILLVACWIATTRQPAVAFHYSEADEPLRHRDDTWTAEDHWRLADAERAEQLAKVKKKEESERSVDPVADPRRYAVHTSARPRRHQPHRPAAASLDDFREPDPNHYVSEPVAARAVKVGTAAGWGVGAATGIGVGALVTALLGRLTRR